MVVRKSSACSLVLPVGVIERVTVSIKVVAIVKPVGTVQAPILTLICIFILKTNHESVAPLLSVEHVHLTSHCADRERTVVADACALLVLQTTLCGNEDNAVGATSTVDSGCRSILQHLHRLDVVRVDHAEAFHHHAVNHIERIGRRVDGSHTADHDLIVISTGLA